MQGDYIAEGSAQPQQWFACSNMILNGSMTAVLDVAFTAREVINDASWYRYYVITSTIFLRLTVDRHLTFTAHKDQLINK